MKITFLYFFIFGILVYKYGISHVLIAIMPYALFWYLVALGLWVVMNALINWIKYR